MEDGVGLAVPPPPRSAPQKPLTEIEKLENDRIRLEIELKELQKALLDTQQMNEDLLIDLKVKDEFLLKQDAILSVLCEKNKAEEQQLDMEDNAQTERYSYDIEAAEKNDLRLSMHLERYRHLTKENDELAKDLDELRLRISDEGLNHAHTIHDMNKAMSTFRQNLEKTLKQKLNAIEEKYQNQAFLSLNERQKREIFENTKLKDEVSLQGVGLANLSLRLGRQKVSFAQCAAEKRTFDQKAALLRDRLNDLQLTKMSRSRVKAQLSEALEELRKKQETANKQLDSLPSLQELQENLIRYRRDTATERILKAMWLRRSELVYLLLAEIKPVSQAERDGYYSSSTFKFENTSTSFDYEDPSSATSLASQEQDDSDTADSLKLSVINAAILKDPLLAEALAPMIGRESLCIAETEQLLGDRNVNIAGWVVDKIVKIWRETEQVGRELETAGVQGVSVLGASLTQSQSFDLEGLQTLGEKKPEEERQGGLMSGDTVQIVDGLSALGETEGPQLAEVEQGESLAPQEPQAVQHNEGEGIPEEAFLKFSPVRPHSSTSPEVSSRLLHTHEYENENEDGQAGQVDQWGHVVESREEIEKLWDLAFATSDDGDRDEAVGASAWYRKVPTARRLPPGVTGASAHGKKFSHDAIRPVDLSYDIGPPLAFVDRQSKKKMMQLSHSVTELDFGGGGGGGSVSLLGNSSSLHNLKLTRKQVVPQTSAHTSGVKDGAKKDDALKQKERLMFSSSGIRLQRVLSAPSMKEPGRGLDLKSLSRSLASLK